MKQSKIITIWQKDTQKSFFFFFLRSEILFLLPLSAHKVQKRSLYSLCLQKHNHVLLFSQDLHSIQGMGGTKHCRIPIRKTTMNSHLSVNLKTGMLFFTPYFYTTIHHFPRELFFLRYVQTYEAMNIISAKWLKSEE